MPEIIERYGAASKEDAEDRLETLIILDGGSGEVFRKDGSWSYRWYPPGVDPNSAALNDAIGETPTLVDGDPQLVAGEGDPVSALLQFIGTFEANDNYNAYYGAPSNTGAPALVEKTLAEVRTFQDHYIAHGSKSSAAGRYQIIRKTLDSLIATTSAMRADLFDAAMQDRLALKLIEGRGYQRYLAGNISTEAFAKNMAKEWAALPVLASTTGHTGKTISVGFSYYHGDGLNKARAPVNEFRQRLEALRA